MNVRAHPVLYTLLPALALAAAGTWALGRYAGIDRAVGWWVSINLVTYPVWWIDKRQASRGGFRVPESTLHLLTLLGGGCGGVMAMQTLRHKTQKAVFRVLHPVFAVLGAGVAGWYLAQ